MRCVKGFSILIAAIMMAAPSAALAQEDPPSADDMDALLDMSLEDILSMEVSSVSRVAEDSSASPAVLTVITQQQIRDFGYRTIADVLLRTPGFWYIVDVNDKLLGVRGIHASTSQKYLLLINGVKANENFWNLTDVDYNISLNNVKRIEIIRGPGSAVYGRAALTAVINVVTDEDLDGYRVEASYGNRGYERLGMAFAKKYENLSVQAWGHAARIGGQRIEQPKKDDNSANPVDGEEIVDRFRGPTGSLGVRVDSDGWTADVFGYVRNYRQQRSAGGALTWQDVRKNSKYTSAYRHGHNGESHGLIVANIVKTIRDEKSEHRLGLNFTWSQLRLRENTVAARDVGGFPEDWTEEDIDTYNEEAQLGQLFEFMITGYRYGAEYFGRQQIGDKASNYAIWGAEAYNTVPTNDIFHANYNAELKDITNEEGEVVDRRLKRIPLKGGHMRELPEGTFDAMRREQLYSAYAELRWSFAGQLHLSVGGRGDVHVKGDDYKQEGQNDRYPDENSAKRRADVKKTSGQFSPRLAVIYQPFGNNDLTVKAIYNRSFIAPGYFYRYAEPSTSYAGGPWLKAETMDNFIFDIEGAMDIFGWRALYYLNIAQDLLSRDTSLTPNRYDSLGKLAIHGAEAEVFVQHKNIYAFANYSFMVGFRELTEGKRNTETEGAWILKNNSLKNFPRHYGSLGATANFVGRQLSLGATMLWHERYKSPTKKADGTKPVVGVDATAQVDLTLTWSPKVIEPLKGLHLGVSVFNLFDQEIRRSGTVSVPYQIAGRWVVGNLQYDF